MLTSSKPENATDGPLSKNDQNSLDAQASPSISHNYMDEKTTKEIDNCFYHRPHGDQPPRYLAINNAMRDFMTLIGTYCPPGRERALAFTHLETARMWANAAIAKNEKEVSGVVCR